MTTATLRLTPAQARRARQHSLLLPAAPGRAAASVVEWHAAMQSQDYSSGLWSLGARMQGTSASDVQGAFERAEILRTWPMRGTIHTVRSSDTRWLLDLTASRALDASARRREQLGLDLDVVDRAATLLTDALPDRTHLTRKQALEVLTSTGIDVSGQRGYYLLWFAAQTGHTCIGPNVGSEQTFVRLDAWAPEQVRFTRPDALTELVHRFFRSHGPATDRDFAGWSGLTLGDTRAGLAANEGRLVPVDVAGAEHWVSVETAELVAGGEFSAQAQTVVLPGFDEFILGFKDRTLQLAPEHFERVVPGGNGMFRATVCVDGRVVGTWVRRLLRNHVAIDVELLEPQSTASQARITHAFDQYADYLGLSLRLTGVQASSA